MRAIDDSPGARLRRGLAWLAAATIFLYLALAALFVIGYIESSHRREEIAVVAQSTNEALCVLRADLQRRVDDSREFLAEHPDGFEGVTPEEIRESLRNTQSTIDALDVLECPAPNVKG